MISIELSPLVITSGDHGFEIIVIQALSKMAHDLKHLLLAHDNSVAVISFRPLLNLVL